MKWSKGFALGMAVAGLGAQSAAQAKATAEEIASLGGPDITYTGAQRKGNGSDIPDYTGKFQCKWPGLKKKKGYTPGPYANEKPLFTITKDNMGEYEAFMTEGQKALLTKYPDSYRMPVYPSHRDLKFRDWVGEVVKKNAAEAEIIDEGLGVTGTSGAHPFPFPKNGLEAIYNTILQHRPYTEKSVFDIADVYANGTIAWGRANFKTLNPGNHPKKRGKFTDKISAYFFQEFILPDREKGFVAVGYQPNNFKGDATQSWQYLPGIRRVRKAPEVGFDYPVPPAGLRTVDDDYLFNGSPERYTWKLVGKKEVIVPYHNFKFNDPSLKYDDLIKPNTVNPDYLRYEKHRVWVIEANLKEGVRHIYKKRTIYVDEDTWGGVWADSYDSQEKLWRANFIATYFNQQACAFHRGASFYHDLTSGAYEASYLTNERGKDWWQTNIKLRPQEFSPEAAARSGH